MLPKQDFKVALIGNPNAGKSSVFNNLTGLRQKVGNFPGVTVDKKTGMFVIEGKTINVIDLPGTYSLYPNSADERIVLNIITNPNDNSFPNAIVYIADATQLERHLLLFTQLRDLNIPTILCLNMMDIVEEQGINLDIKKLEAYFNTDIISLNARSGSGMQELKQQILLLSNMSVLTRKKMFYQPQPKELEMAEKIRFEIPEVRSTYQAILLAHHFNALPHLNTTWKETISKITKNVGFEDLRFQITETLQRFNSLQPIIQEVVIKKKENAEKTFTDVIDEVVTHAFWGPILFFGILFLIFQSIFTFAEIPKNGIEHLFIYTNTFIKEKLGDFWLTDLFTNGILAGLSGVLAFIPQIMILFLFITLLEEVGYMARAVYLFDRVMQKVGLNGRSIVALVAGGACAIPAIMSTRTISNKKERLITILVTPFISCSARIPVYTLLVGFVVQSTHHGFFNEQGLVFTGLYLLGIVTALSASFVLKKILKTEENTFLALELPSYKLPHWRNVFLTLYEKVKTFITQAGSTIMVVSIFLWFLASFSPSPKRIITDIENYKTTHTSASDSLTYQNYESSKKLEYSFAGYLGKAIEPVIRPLGFDWKIGIALLSSFAAREVFVGTMATIYSVGDAADNTETIRDKMIKEKRPDGTPLYTLATSLSLLIFYVFALQCMSTLAVVQRETKSWFWPIVQFIFMGLLAYVSSFIVFRLFS